MDVDSDGKSGAGRVWIAPPGPLGVVGGGQLGRMFAMAAARLGYDVVTLTGSAEDPAARVSRRVVAGDDADPGTRAEFARLARGVTIEFENVDAEGLRYYEELGLPTRPGWFSVRTARDRLLEKTFLRDRGFATAPWRPLRTEGELEEAAGSFGFPAILKTSSQGYDGKGQARVERGSDLAAAWEGLGRAACVLEGLVDFEAELSVIVARGADGELATYPIQWNTHARHILDTTVAPAPIGPILSLEARELGVAVAEALGHAGVLTVELFLTRDGRLLVNELAPRPHNSGHWTIEGADCDQFEQQARALCGLPLGSAAMRRPGAAMANLLGEVWGNGEPDWAAGARLDPGVKLHLYGKSRAAPGRKMGHLTALDDDPERARARVLAVRDVLAGWA